MKKSIGIVVVAMMLAGAQIPGAPASVPAGSAGERAAGKDAGAPGHNGSASLDLPATNALTLDKAIRVALINNPESRAFGGRVEAAVGRARQAGVWTNPELGLSAEDWALSGNHAGFSDAKQLVGVAQTVPFPGKKRLDRQIGAAGLRLSEAELKLRQRELARDVKSAFCQALAAERLTAVARELVKVAEDAATTARKRVEAGAAADQEQLRAEIPLEQARSELAGFQRDLETARQTLAMLLGRTDLKDIPLAGALAETSDGSLLEQRPEQWLPRHPAEMVARRNRERAELESRRARLEPYPDVRIGVAGGREEQTGDSIVQVSLSVPLPILDRSKGRKQEARANVDVAEAEQAATEQRLLREWGTARQRVQTAAEQTANYRERILPKAEDALRLVRTGFEQGKFGFIDLLDTLRTAAEARLAYQQKLLELNLAQAELEAIVGAGPAARVNEESGLTK